MKKSELVQLIRECLTEAVVGISPKDWDRMSALVLKGDRGESVAKLINDKNKAIARFVAGSKLANDPLKYDDRWKSYSGTFSYLGNKALELGATSEEIENIYNAATVPDAYTEKISKLGSKDKKQKDRFVGDITRAVLNAGFDITYLPHNGYAITRDGKDAMSRNGRKWTIGYKAEIDLNGKKINFIFDAITDEGDGPTYYIADSSSDKMFYQLTYRTVGKNEFISKIKSILSSIN